MKKRVQLQLLQRHLGIKKCLIPQALKKKWYLFDLFYNHFLGNIKLIIEYKSDNDRLIGNAV